MHLNYNNVNENYTQDVCLSVPRGEGHAPLYGGDAILISQIHREDWLVFVRKNCYFSLQIVMQTYHAKYRF